MGIYKHDQLFHPETCRKQIQLVVRAGLRPPDGESNMLTDHLAMPPASIVSTIWVIQQPGDSHYKFIIA